MSSEIDPNQQFEPIRVEIARIQLNPGDKLVANVQANWNKNQREALKRKLEEFAPGHKALVVSAGAELFTFSANEPVELLDPDDPLNEKPEPIDGSTSADAI